MTTENTANWLTELADDRQNTLALLANSANQSHRWAEAIGPGKDP